MIVYGQILMVRLDVEAGNEFNEEPYPPSRGILEDEDLSTSGRRNEYNVCQSDIELIELFRLQSF